MLSPTMGLGDGLRAETLIASFKEAIGGRRERLYTHLGIQSGLPGTRMNDHLAHAFAAECVSAGAAAEALVREMASLSPEAAPGATSREFLPVCGILALGARAAHEPRNSARIEHALHALHEASEDPRFRVRAIVPVALAKLGAAMGEPFVRALGAWTDGFFHASAALLALSQPELLANLNNEAEVLARLDESFALASKAARSTSRYPGRKALIDALALASSALALRFGVPVFDRLVHWANTQDPDVRNAIETALRNPKISSRYGSEIQRVQSTLSSALPPPRDPTLLVKGMRSRSKKKGRYSKH